MGHFKLSGALYIYRWVHSFFQRSRRKEYNILEHRNQLFHSPGSVCKVKCTANRFRASSESGAIWPVSSMINEKSGPILGLIDCVSHPLWIQTFLSSVPLMLPAELTEHTLRFKRERQRVEIYTSSFSCPTLMVTNKKVTKKSLSLSECNKLTQRSVLLLTSTPFLIQCYLDFVRPVHPASYQSRIYSSSVNTKDALLTNQSSQYSLWLLLHTCWTD